MTNFSEYYYFYQVKSDDDFLDYLAIKSSPEQVLWSGFKSAPNPVEFKDLFYTRFINSSVNYLFFLRNKSTNELIGYSQLRKINENLFEQMGMGVYQKYQGQGFGSYIHFLISQKVFEFSSEKIITLTSFVSQKNTSSLKALFKAGYKKTGLQTKRFIQGFNCSHVFLEIEKKCTK